MSIEEPSFDPESHIAQFGIIDVFGVNPRASRSSRRTFFDRFDGLPSETRRKNIRKQQCGAFFLKQYYDRREKSFLLQTDNVSYLKAMILNSLK